MNSQTKADKHTKQEAIVAMFDEIAKDYDKTNRILSLGIDISWRKDAVKRAYKARSSKDIGRIVDVACGSGDMIKHWHNYALESSIMVREIIGIDPAREMLKIAEKKLQALGDNFAEINPSATMDRHTNANVQACSNRNLDSTNTATPNELAQDSKTPQEILESTNKQNTASLEKLAPKIQKMNSGCALRLYLGEAKDLSAIENQSVDMLSISYGLRNVLEYEQALSEFARVLKPGGIVIVLEFFKKSSPNLLDRIIRIYTKHILPCIGYLISRNYAAYKYLPDSMEEFITPDELTLALEKVGIRTLGIKSYSAGISHLVLGQKPHNQTKTIYD